jgi:poly(3-hydroxybutyrate) depolymerase
MKILAFIFTTALGIFAQAQGLSKAEASKLAEEKWTTLREHLAQDRAAEMKERSITIDGKTMRFLEKKFGEAPEDGRPLFISMHGGGGAPAQVNDQQWQNQIRLYQPEGSLYIAPRAPTDTWNLWHEAHIDGLFDRLIANCIAIHQINPNKVYVMGYSAGGDGVYQIGPRMADRWAAAAMMAGHPNESKPDSLRNLPFALQVGGKDVAYQRNTVTADWAAQLDTLEKANPGSYQHFLHSYTECGHWMELKDAVAVPWMLKHTRNPWPKAITWLQDDATSSRFYWLAIDAEKAKAGQKIDARCDGQKISIETKDYDAITLRLSDELLDLDKEITVTWNGKKVFSGKVSRSAQAIETSLQERADRSSIATALLEVRLK